jgi:hypothetical protein
MKKILIASLSLLLTTQLHAGLFYHAISIDHGGKGIEFFKDAKKVLKIAGGAVASGIVGAGFKSIGRKSEGGSRDLFLFTGKVLTFASFVVGVSIILNEDVDDLKENLKSNLIEQYPDIDQLDFMDELAEIITHRFDLFTQSNNDQVNIKLLNGQFEKLVIDYGLSLENPSIQELKAILVN